MTDDKIDVGEVVRITNGDGFKTKPALALFDPVDVELDVRSPDGTSQTYTDAVNDSTGLYHRDVTVDVHGRWRFRWDGDGVVEQGHFDVVRNRITDPVSPEPEP